MTTADFRPTHVIPPAGLPAWQDPDVSRPTEPLDPLLPVRLVDRRGDWGRILCANGWSAWVDGRLLITVPETPPAPGLPPARTADPRPLLARAERALAEYREAVEELMAGRIDGEGFRERTRGRRVGLVADGESVWLYDAEHERWVYGDGRSLSTFAVPADPVDPADPAGRGASGGRDASGGAEPTGGVPAEGTPAREPTRVVPAETGPAPDPTRVVPAKTAPDPTRVAAPPSPPPTRVVPAEDTPAPEPTRVVPAKTAPAPDPTRVVPAEPDQEVPESTRTAAPREGEP